MSSYAPPGPPSVPHVGPTGEVEDSQQTENAVAEKKKSEPRPYHVFKKVGDGTWQFLDTKQALSPEQAIKALGLEVVEFGTTYAAVPQRNWTEKTPQRRPEDITF